MPATKKRGNGSHTKYGEGAQKEVKKEMHNFKRRKAKSGTSGTKVKSKKQDIRRVIRFPRKPQKIMRLRNMT